MIEAVHKNLIREARKPCAGGASTYRVHTATRTGATGVWLCSRLCSARGLSYEGALRRKIRLDLLSWRDLRRSAQALMRC